MWPMILSQVYILWLVVSGQTTYFQALLLPAMEMLCIGMISALLFSPSILVAGGRLGDVLFTAGILLLVFVFLFVAGLVGGKENAMDALGQAFGLRTLTQGLSYIMLTLLGSAVAALASGNFGRWWYVNVVMPAGMILVALLATTFFSFLMLAFSHGEMPSSVLTIVLVIFFVLTRLLLAYHAGARLTQAELDDGYKSFRAGAKVEGTLAVEANRTSQQRGTR
jgi:hypothetical protein